jgi:hypothetical protein
MQRLHWVTSVAAQTYVQKSVSSPVLNGSHTHTTTRARNSVRTTTNSPLPRCAGAPKSEVLALREEVAALRQSIARSEASNVELRGMVDELAGLIGAK